MSILNKDLTLNIDKTITHAEMVIDNGCHGVAIFGIILLLICIEDLS